MSEDRKHMRKLREKRLNAIQEQIEKHEEKIENEEGRRDTTPDYWRKEIDTKFLPQIKKDKKFLGEENDNNKESS